ncbi:MAG TPA: phosphoribosylanthranilate isomerase [Pirellulales bacterium]|jgi:phosphoribosylanthranilate isomerase
MFRIKICGITHRPDAFVAAALGADAIGLNFFEGSPRYLPPSLAGNVAAAIPRGVAKVGVFVNPTAEEVNRLAKRLRLDFIQLAGDEPPELIAQLAGQRVIKSFRFGADGIGPLLDFLDEAARHGAQPAAVLIDSSSPGQFGGTGVTADWGRLAKKLEQIRSRPMHVMLAGGLTPENITEAITTVKPAAVDVASGVEYSPGRKDASRVSQFIESAIAAFADTTK